MIRPSITFWKSVFKRHTSFALEPKEIEFQGSADYGKRVVGIIPRNGDIMAKLWLRIDLGQLDAGNGGARYVDDVGRAIIDEIELEIGSVVYDRLRPEYMHAWEELTKLAEKQYGILTGKSSSVAQLTAWATATQKLYIPIPFYFGDEWGSGIPLVSLHLTDVKINVKFKNKSDIIVSTGGPYTITTADALLADVHLLAETVYLDDPERDWFADTQLKYVIHQTQFLGAHAVSAGVTSSNIDLHFNHPTKELIFMYRTDTNKTNLNWFNFDGEEANNEAFKTVELTLNGSERFRKRDPYYFRIVQPEQHHSRIPDKRVHTYSFALYPEDSNPSGSINFSRIDNTRLKFEWTAALVDSAEILVYARNINTCTVGNGVMLLSMYFLYIDQSVKCDKNECECGYGVNKCRCVKSVNSQECECVENASESDDKHKKIQWCKMSNENIKTNKSYFLLSTQDTLLKQVKHQILVFTNITFVSKLINTFKQKYSFNFRKIWTLYCKIVYFYIWRFDVACIKNNINLLFIDKFIYSTSSSSARTTQ